VVVAHYGDGSVSVLPREAEGRVGPVAEVVQHVGASVNPERQEGPHAHQAIFGPDGAVLVADLGIDQVLAYALDEGTGELRPRGTPGVVQPGSGPRHMAFSRDGRFLYLLNELTYTVTVFAYDGAGLSPLQTVPMLPESFAGNSGADIHLTPDGAWLYASNRGHDSLARFAVNAVTGMLEPRGHTPTGGRTPRNFAVDPDGVFLLAANQDSGRVVVFRIDAATGELEETGGALDIPAPVCVLFARG
jgi:6-phosphogluconolactonase